MFHATIKHYQAKFKVYDEELRNGDWQDIAFLQAQHIFYGYLTNEIKQFMNQLDPTRDTDHMMVQLNQLVNDFYHLSGIGSPDSQSSIFAELMGLKTNEEIEDTAREWAKSNPLAAMRWLYAKEMNPISPSFPLEKSTGSLEVE